MCCVNGQAYAPVTDFTHSKTCDVWVLLATHGPDSCVPALRWSTAPPAGWDLQLHPLSVRGRGIKEGAPAPRCCMGWELPAAEPGWAPGLSGGQRPVHSVDKREWKPVTLDSDSFYLRFNIFHGGTLLFIRAADMTCEKLPMLFFHSLFYLPLVKWLLTFAGKRGTFTSIHRTLRLRILKNDMR